MKKHIHKIATYTALILVSSLPLSIDVLADDEKKQPSSILSSTDKNTALTQRKILAEKQQQVVDEAQEAISGTEQALNALEKKDSKNAVSILQTVSSKLDIVLAKSPALALVPANVETDILDFEGDAKSVSKAIDKADDLLDSGKIQSAREIMSGLASEIRITTINIPVGTFPVAIKEAIKLIDAGKIDEAANVLNNVLNTLVEVTEVIPLPLLRAEALLTEASELEHKTDLSKESSRAEVLKFADAAKDKLKLAILLGYGSKSDYKILFTAIDEIKETIHSEKSAATWNSIKQAFSKLKDKVLHPQK